MDQTFSVCRLVYNMGLEIKTSAWRSKQINLSAYDLSKQLSELREAYPFIAEVNCGALHQALNNLDAAFNSFFKESGFPRFKRKNHSRQSFACHNNTRKIDWNNQTLTIPKIKDIPIELSRKFEGEIKTIIISKTKTGKYFASIRVDENKPPASKPPIDSITSTGIDLGVKSFVITSGGMVYAPNRFLKQSIDRLKYIQSRVSRKKRGSKNRKKANLYVARLHEKIANQRADYIHKITTELIRDNQTNTFVIEDLAVSNMLKNRKLSQSISDASFGEFIRQMRYKCDWYGKNLIVIYRFAPSSKRCSECGEINAELTLADREWTCACGAQHDRDLNAAKNIKFFGLNSGAGSAGEPVESRRLRRAKKQENAQTYA